MRRRESRIWDQRHSGALVRRRILCWGRRGAQNGFTRLLGVSTSSSNFCCLARQALGLAGLVGEAEESAGTEEEDKGPLCTEKRFLQLSDGALLLRVLGVM